MCKILFLNCPNLNLLCKRNPDVYGSKTLSDINLLVEEKAKTLNVEVLFYQSNSEGDLIDCNQNNRGAIDGIVINPGALTHYGYSLKDALLDAAIPVIEIHLSNIHGREEWRRSILSDSVTGQIAGFGWRSYTAALEVIAGVVDDSK